MVEATGVVPEGRITSKCAGIWNDEQAAAFKKIVDFVHQNSETQIGIQLAHAGRKASTWNGVQTDDETSWETVAPSPIPYKPGERTPHELTVEEIRNLIADFKNAAKRALEAGFNLIEIHAAHGYLLSTFISPVSNVRTDNYGGSLENRMRYPLEVLKAMRAVWPDEKPMSVRISANDWVGDDGVTPDEAIVIARMFADAGADLIDVSAGQTTVEAKPVYGRMFQTPFSDRIRNEAGLTTMAVGNIFEADHANSILMAGRADLVAVGRPHLTDPYWTLHEGAKISDRAAPDWPLPYLAGRDQLWRLADKNAETVGKV